MKIYRQIVIIALTYQIPETVK